MRVIDLCHPPVVVVSPKATLQQAAVLMEAKSVGCLIVIDAMKNVIGLITDRDIVIRSASLGAAPDMALVESAMTTDIVSVPGDTALPEAIATMRAAGVRRLVIHDGAARLCGIVSADDLLSTLVRWVDELSAVYALPRPVGSPGFNRDFTRMA